MAFKLYNIKNNKAIELKKRSLKFEKELQNLIEENLEIIFGIKFIRSEFSIGERYGGRMDTIGIDENSSPVILEYKRNKNENIINQALFYLDWLVDHKGDFEILVRNKFKQEIDIDWSSPRVLCIAEQFNKYDTYAVSQMGRPIELIQYHFFEDHLLGIDILTPFESTDLPKKKEVKVHKVYDLEWHKKRGTNTSVEIFEELQEFILNLGEDIIESPQKYYIAYRTIRNFACIEIHKKHLLIYTALDPNEVDVNNDILRDVREIGHYGTGDLEIRIENPDDIPLAKELIEKAYKFIS
jgi:predicted transport protein